MRKIADVHPPPRLLLLAALRIEERALASAITGLDHVVLRRIGPRARFLPPMEGFGLVILAGLSGGLDPSLKCGDVVVDGTVAALPAIDSMSIRAGRLLTSPNLIATPDEKRGLFTRDGALAVDMETDLVRRAADAARLPFISIRSILDTAEESLDAAMMNLVDEHGKPHWSRILQMTLRRPSLLPQMIRAGRASSLACRNLGRATAEMLRSYPAG